MKISIFTPVHNPKHLTDSWHSIQQQGYDDYEWVVVPNNGVTVADIDLPEHPRIRIIPDAPETDRIGALKRFACDNCRGDVFLELDADDMLMPLTLPKVASTAESSGFIYSDAAIFAPDLQSWGYSTSFGWKHYDVYVYGRKFTATATFPLHPRALAEVYFAPDHLRAWTREAYYKAGGHDAALYVGDDHDLVCRTYLSGAGFGHIGGCGYLYRVHSDNTVPKRQKEIGRQSDANRDKYLLPMIDEWVRRTPVLTTPRLDLKDEMIAGTFIPEIPNGYIMQEQPDSSLLQIKAHDVLQYVPSKLLPAFFNEAYRCLAPGGFLNIIVPSERGRYAGMNPYHVTRFNPNSFLYYCDRTFADSLKVYNGDQDVINCRFQAVTRHEFYPDPGFEQLDMLCIRADLMAVKGQRVPGQVKI